MVYVYFFLASSSLLIDWKKGDRCNFSPMFGEMDTFEHIYILIDMCIYKSVHKCHINLIVSLGTYPFSNEYSERYLPYFCHPRDVTCERWLVYHESSSTCNNPGKRYLCELLYYYMPIFYNIRARGISHRHAATTLQAIDICRAGARRPVTF